MPFNEKLAARVRSALSGPKNTEEKRMMGGLTFMLNRKMCLGVLNDDLMVRFAPSLHESVLKKKGCREMDFTAPPMRGYVFVGPADTASQKDLDGWVRLAVEFNARAKAAKKK